MRLLADAVSGALQSLQVRSGLLELPERVRNCRAAPVGTSARQVTLPHREAVPESCTVDSYEPDAPGPSPMRKMRPMLPVAASTECSLGNRRTVSPSLV